MTLQKLVFQQIHRVNGIPHDGPSTTCLTCQDREYLNGVRRVENARVLSTRVFVGAGLFILGLVLIYRLF